MACLRLIDRSNEAQMSMGFEVTDGCLQGAASGG